MDTDDFKNHLLTYFAAEEKIGNIDWDAWLFTTGMPPYIPAYVVFEFEELSDFFFWSCKIKIRYYTGWLI